MAHPSGRLLDMASERQIAANRRNANKSSGPRSAAGRKRASNNAYRHGLFSKRARAAVTEEMEALAHLIAGEVTSAIAFEHASVAAEAEVELGRIRDAKRALMDRTGIFDNFKTPTTFPTDPRKDPWLMSAIGRGRRSPPIEAEDSSRMQQEEAERSEAIKLVLSELTKLSLYEKRAAARRDRTIRKLMKIKQAPVSRVEKDDSSKA
jgi:hypothetical protein